MPTSQKLMKRLEPLDAHLSKVTEEARTHDVGEGHLSNLSLNKPLGVFNQCCLLILVKQSLWIKLHDDGVIDNHGTCLRTQYTKYHG